MTVRPLCVTAGLASWWLALGQSWAVPPTRAGKVPYQTDGTRTWYDDPDDSNPAKSLRVAQTRPVTLYRLNHREGIYVVAGAEILFPGLPAPVKRELSILQDSLEVIDQAADGTNAFTFWDVSALINPFLPPPAKLAEDLTTLTGDKPEAGELDEVHWRHDLTFDIFLNEQGEAVDGSRFARGHQGTMFVDDANRVFFTPPTGAKMFFPKSADVHEITGVTHLARRGLIVCEWTREDDHNYHVVGIQVSTRKPVFDFAPADSLSAQGMLTWIDDHQLLGQFTARKFSEYTVVNLRKRRASRTSTNSGYTPMIVQNGRVEHHRFPKPDDN